MGSPISSLLSSTTHYTSPPGVRLSWGTSHKNFTHAQAVANTKVLFAAAKNAGVERIVHISITNPSEDSPLEYFRGKAALEGYLKGLGIPYAILRPAVIFGREDILVNNIAWVLRRSPVFGVFGKGEYRLQPIYVEDLAQIAVAQGESRENVIIDALGPETFTYRELIKTIARILRKKRLILPLPPAVAYLGAYVFGKFMGDILLTWDEVKGLMSNKLYVDSPPTGRTNLTTWAEQHAETLGRTYASELARRS